MLRVCLRKDFQRKVNEMARQFTTKYESNKQEEKVAKEIGGRKVIASGSIEGLKGDVRDDKYLIECKTTSRSAYLFKKDVWRKISRESLKDGFRIPVLNIDLKNGEKRICIMWLEDYMSLRDLKERVVFNHYHKTTQSIKIDQKLMEEGFPFTVDFEAMPKNVIVFEWQEFLDIKDGGIL